MAQATDDLSMPLGQTVARSRRRTLPLLPVTAGALAVFLLTFAGVAIFGEAPKSGEPSASAEIAALPAAGQPEKPAAAAAAEPTAVAAADAGKTTVTIIDGSSGTRQSVVVPNTDPSAPSTAMDGNAAGPAKPTVDRRLLENSRYGMIPVAAAGLTPIRAYAAASDTERARAAKLPNIAIVVTGLGVGAAKAGDAIAKLPPAVTLGFTPYGANLDKLVEQARAARHEVLLQVPMEPFDYPNNDPGPQTLLNSLGAEQNIDRLHWHLSRLQGYVGLTPYMGARLITNDDAMQPIIQDAHRRGLGYFDDGRSARTNVERIAEAQAMPFARSDLVLDAVPNAGEIDQALAKLERIARERGTAVGTASSLGVSIERIAIWAKSLQSRGIALVPLTTIMLKPKSGG